MFASIVTGREVKGFMLEAKGRDKGTEKCRFIPRRDELATRKPVKEARFRTQASKAGHSYSSETDFFPHGSATVPFRRHC